MFQISLGMNQISIQAKGRVSNWVLPRYHKLCLSFVTVELNTSLFSVFHAFVYHNLKMFQGRAEEDDIIRKDNY